MDTGLRQHDVDAGVGAEEVRFREGERRSQLEPVLAKASSSLMEMLGMPEALRVVRKR